MLLGLSKIIVGPMLDSTFERSDMYSSAFLKSSTNINCLWFHSGLLSSFSFGFASSTFLSLGLASSTFLSLGLASSTFLSLGFASSLAFGLPFWGFMKQKQEQHGHWNKNFILSLSLPPLFYLS
ncbi:hypothetical protein K7X08_027229 [Anisodus acutangulus]|uniref:Uncharacterized protein n=1 Tax=Anisodus acutangulus TaxID=402998 RepID=A0A9Q1MMF4_9SOLA|nr:hypothetical protein K7X08_027229 [Anisodus acutangulus]